MTTTSNEPSVTPRCVRLLSALTHELRTPLGSVLMLAEMMMSSENGGHEATRARKVHQAAEDMRTLLDQVTQWVRIESGRSPCTVEPIDAHRLQELLEQGREGWGASPPPEVYADSALLSTVSADPKLLVDIVGLLVDGIQADSPHAIRMVLGPDRVDEPTSAVVTIAVHHPNIEVSPEQLVNLFEPFQTSVQKVGRRHGGQTLSLTIAQALCLRMNATLKARSDQEGSLIFDLTLPTTD